MKLETVKSFTQDQIDQVADALYQVRDQCQVYAFKGTLGAGKTTLSQEIVASLWRRRGYYKPYIYLCKCVSFA